MLPFFCCCTVAEKHVLYYFRRNGFDDEFIVDEIFRSKIRCFAYFKMKEFFKLIVLYRKHVTSHQVIKIN